MSISIDPHLRVLGKAERRARAHQATWDAHGDWCPVTDDAWRAWRRVYRRALRQISGSAPARARTGCGSGVRRPACRARRTRRVARTATGSDGGSDGPALSAVLSRGGRS